MSLRARLTLQNMLIVGVILFLFGTALYLAIQYALTAQINNSLAMASDAIRQELRFDQRGTLGMVETPKLNQFPDIYFQIWGRDGQLKFYSSNLGSYKQPLDGLNMLPSTRNLRDTQLFGLTTRVLSIPLAAAGNSDRIIGVLQVGIGLGMVNGTLQILSLLLLIGTAVAVAIAGIAGWYSIRQTLKPLDLVTQTALQITRADDLSRRIPYRGSPDDEVGQLILAFNQTLSRLENLFNSQSRFLTDVGHELRTPLTVIKGNVDLMRRLDCTDEESLESIENEVDRLTRLVGDLLLLAQAESGQVPLAHRTVELDSLALEVLQQMKVLARERVKLKLDEIDQVLVCGDQDKLKQVLVNLIGNAIQYTPSGGNVVVGVGKSGTRGYLKVCDNGPGIPPEDVPFIFERFYRGEKSRTRSKDGKGFGLGLSIVYWIIHNHGGDIEVSPNQPHGTIFTVWLDLAIGPCPDEITNK